MSASKLGWILIHAHALYPEGDYETPQAQLKGEYEPGMLWHWIRSRPMKSGGPYTILFAWEGDIFGESTADVTQKIEDPAYNFAFKLNDYEERQSVKLDDLPVPRRPRDLIKLTPEILAKYRKLTSG
jgi:hypothetical protein